jgi:hypothetical protein
MFLLDVSMFTVVVGIYSPTPDWISPASLGKWPGGASEGTLGHRGRGVGIVCTRGIRACIFPNAARGGGTLGLIP